MLPGPTPSLEPRTNPVLHWARARPATTQHPMGPAHQNLADRPAALGGRLTFDPLPTHVINSTAACRPFPSTSGRQKDRYGWPHRMRANAWKSLRTATLCAGARRLRLLSVAGFPSASVLQ